MKTQLKELKERLNTANIYDEKSGDCIHNDVMRLVDYLEQQINEVSMRLECVKKTTADIRSSIGNYTSIIDEGGTARLTFDDHEVIYRSAIDIEIAVDLSDCSPIIENWYDLFKKEIFTFESSWGQISCDDKGVVLYVNGPEYIDGEANYLHGIKMIDIPAYKKYCNERGLTNILNSDILCVGYINKDNTYVKPQWYVEKDKKWDAVEEIISKLKSLEVDGEMMQYIIEQVGMKEQIINQLNAELI